ncbi:MAG TPA: pitrilysin family protein [Stellaceae bacterium]|nr:pitrilysin family protein [Stellaceae bacterium]
MTGRIAAILVALACMTIGAGAAPAATFAADSFTLPNGLQVAVIPNHRAPIVSQMVWYKVGGADEPRGVSGIAHFLEHLMFRGTKNVAPGEFSRIVADNGGHENAFTTHDETAFYQDVAADRLETVMRLEADRMANLDIKDETLLPERQVIIEERHMRVDNNPMGLFRQALDAALYLNHPYRIPVIGWPQEMSVLTSAEARDFYRTWYAPNNAVLVISGDVDPTRVKALAEKYFGPIPGHPVPKRARASEPPRVASETLTMKSPRVTEPSWLRAYLAPSYTSGAREQAYALQVLAEVLGGGDTSRLYKELVVDKKLALNAAAYYDPTSLDLASFGLYATVAKGVAVEDMQAAMVRLVGETLRDGVAPAEVARAEKRMQAESLYAQDSLDGLGESVGAALAAGRTVKDVQEWPERIGAVTVDQVNAALRAVVRDDKSVTGILLPEPTS